MRCGQIGGRRLRTISIVDSAAFSIYNTALLPMQEFFVLSDAIEKGS
jgi:hypothetical protein